MAKHILFCNCGGERIHSDLLSTVDKHIKSLPVKVTKISDLCGLVAHKKEEFSELIKEDADYMVIGCYHRTMNLLFEQIEGETTKHFDFTHINMIESSADEAIRKINQFCDNQPGDNDHHEIIEGTDWPSWYPVIDYSRCTACGQCANFCLFGTYEIIDGQVKVVNPEACKNNCPACARICPSVAIIFPKYKNGGAIGGSEDIDEQAEMQRQANDVESLLGGDIYAALERRKAKRQSIIREEAMKKAYSERSSALSEILKNNQES